MLRILIFLFIANSGIAVSAQNQKLLDRALKEIDSKVTGLQQKLDRLESDYGTAAQHVSRFFHTAEPLIGEVLTIDYLNRVVFAWNEDKNVHFKFLIPRGLDPYLIVVGRTYNFGDCRQVDPSDLAPTYEIILTTSFEKHWRARKDQLKKELDSAKTFLDTMQVRKSLTKIYQLQNGTELVGTPSFRSGKIIFDNLVDGQRYIFSGLELDQQHESTSALFMAWKIHCRELLVSSIDSVAKEFDLSADEIRMYRLKNGREFLGHVIEFTDQHIKMMDLTTKRTADVRIQQLDETHESTASLIQEFKLKLQSSHQSQ